MTLYSCCITEVKSHNGHKKEERRVSNCLKLELLLNYEGQIQTYFCVAVVLTPFQVVVLNIL